jgi:ABC-type lipoprotein export system ATPase subunit/ABC-type antimicrobial peptide transport system permease subunit
MIRLKNISKFYSKNQTVSLGLRKVNLEFGLNEFVAIVGESGSGKTTLLNVISGIDTYEEGELYINNEETSYYSKADWENYRKKYIAFIFQNYNLIESYTVLQNVEAALILSGYPKDELRQRALDIIERVGLLDHIKHKATKLSGGQKQRVVIARAIAKDAPIIVADEPTGNLDSDSAKKIIDLLAEIAKEKLVIVVTHDFSQVKDQATRRIRVFDGEIVEDKKIEKVDVQDLPSLEDKDYQMNFKETMKMVLRNLLATPKKTILLFVIFAFAIFFFAFVFATSISLRNDLQFNNSSFDFAPSQRIVLKKDNGDPFTQSELDDLKSMSRVNSLVPYDFMMDNSRYVEQDWYFDIASPRFISPIMLPQSLLGNDYDLADDEIVVSLPEWYFDELNMGESLEGEDLVLTLLGDEFRFEMIEAKDSSDLFEIFENSYTTAVFVNEKMWNDFGKVFGFNSYLDFNFKFQRELANQIDYISFDLSNKIKLNEDLADDEIRLLTNGSFSDVQGKLTVENLYQKVEEDDIWLLYGDLPADQMERDILEVNSHIYNQFFNNDNLYQISLFANDQIEAEQLYSQLNRNDAYNVIYPADASVGDNDIGFIVNIAQFMLLLLFGGIFIGIFFISYAIIRNIINSKMNDYAIFRTIGANKSTIKSFIYLETLFMAVFAYFVFLVAVLIITPIVKPDSPLYILKYFDFMNMVYLLLFMGIFSLLLSRRYLSRVYEDSVAETLRREME